MLAAPKTVKLFDQYFRLSILRFHSGFGATNSFMCKWNWEDIVTRLWPLVSGFVGAAAKRAEHLLLDIETCHSAGQGRRRDKAGEGTRWKTAAGNSCSLSSLTVFAFLNIHPPRAFIISGESSEATGETTAPAHNHSEMLHLLSVWCAPSNLVIVSFPR